MPTKPTFAVRLRKLADLTPDPRNARTHSDEQIDQLVGLIERFGWSDPILHDEMIRAGHGRYEAAKRIYADGGTIYLMPGEANGGKAIPAGTVPVTDCSGWSEEDRRAFALAHNQSALNAGWDERLLAQDLVMLQTEDFDVELLGFDQDRVNELVASLDHGSGPNPPDQFPEFNEEIETEHQCPKCSYRWSGKAS